MSDVRKKTSSQKNNNNARAPVLLCGCVCFSPAGSSALGFLGFFFCVLVCENDLSVNKGMIT